MSKARRKRPLDELYRPATASQKLFVRSYAVRIAQFLQALLGCAGSSQVWCSGPQRYLSRRACPPGGARVSTVGQQVVDSPV